MKRGDLMRLTVAVVIAIIFIGTGAAGFLSERLRTSTLRFSYMRSRCSILS